MLVGHMMQHHMHKNSASGHGLTSLLFGSLFCAGSASVLFALHAMSSRGMRLSSTLIMNVGPSTAW